MSEMYHYQSCGLQNIYLRNGFKYRETQYGKTVAIHDIEGLHKAIGLLIINNKTSLLNGSEIKFLRVELDMPQKTLAPVIA